jgi:hypothetical protein
MRFSIRWLFAIFVLAATTTAATTRPSYWWACALWTAAIATLCASVAGSAICQGPKRAFWISFALFGWIYAVLVFGPWFDSRTGGLLITRPLLAKIGRAAGVATTELDAPNIWADHSNPLFSIQAYGSTQFIVASQSLMTVLIALAGGCVGSYFYRSGRGNP